MDYENTREKTPHALIGLGSASAALVAAVAVSGKATRTSVKKEGGVGKGIYDHLMRDSFKSQTWTQVPKKQPQSRFFIRHTALCLKWSIKFFHNDPSGRQTNNEVNSN